MAIKDRSSEIDLSVDRIPGTEPIDTVDMYGDTDSSQSPEMMYSALLEQFRHRMYLGWDYWSIPHEASNNDVHFAYISQWDESVKSERALTGRPSLEINMIPQYINQVVGVARRSKFSVHVASKSTAEMTAVRRDGSKISNAEIVEGIIRDIEVRSDAHEVYCRALQHAVEGGFGWMRIRTEIMPDDPFNVEVIIEHIADRYSVIYDPKATRDDLRDAEWACITITMDQKEFEKRYPDIGSPTSPGAFTSIGSGTSFSGWWSSRGEVRICEYYYKEAITVTAVRFVHSETGYELSLYAEESEDIFDELIDQGYVETERKEDFKTWRVMLLRCIADQIIEEPVVWPGIHIPIVPVFGRRVDHNGRRYFNSLIRYAHDPSRMVSYWLSAMTERVANSPKMPYMLTPEMISGHEEQWGRLDKDNMQFLLYNKDEEGGNARPIREMGATMPSAETTVVQFAERALRSGIGMHESNLGESGNETSGVAIKRRQDAGNTSVYEFMDNLASSVKYVGEILCDIIPKIYSGAQIRRIVLPNESTTLININHKILDEESGKTFMINSISMCRFNCSITSGPGYATQREEFFTTMTEMYRANPQGMAPIWDLVMKMSDLPNSSQIANRLLHLVPPSMLSPEEKEQVGQPEPTPEQEVSMAEQQSKMKVAESKTQIAQLQLEVANLKLLETQQKAENAVNQSEMNQGQGQGEEEGGSSEEQAIRAMIKQIMAEERMGKST